MIFLDSVSTTACCEAALREFQLYSAEIYGNPSSSHKLGRAAAQAISRAREHFAGLFDVEPDQVIFTGSGTESDNLAIIGAALGSHCSRVLCSTIEHSAVKQSVQSLKDFGIETALIAVNSRGQIEHDLLSRAFSESPSARTLVSIHQVNNVVGTILPVEDLAQLVKTTSPQTIFHTDAVQAFGRIPTPRRGSSVDLVSISAHKIEGPKGVGALIVLNRDLLKGGIRPLIWGGGQEGGLRSGTQNAGLIAGFHRAAEFTFQKREQYTAHTLRLRNRLIEQIKESPLKSKIIFNSFEDTGKDAVPHIVNFSIPGIPGGVVSRLLEEDGFLVSTGSACGSHKTEPDPVLKAMGISQELQGSGIRVSFSDMISIQDIDLFVNSLTAIVDRLARIA